MLALSADQLELVRAILARRLPGVEARVFGSRARGDARAMSDLDLLMPSPLEALDRAQLRDDFSESDLPFRVDIVDAAATGPEFLRAIEADSEPLA
jgi:predicted nucleotidyltransferase